MLMSTTGTHSGLTAELVNRSISQGVEFLARNQLAHGEFKTLLAPGKHFHGDKYAFMIESTSIFDSSPFITSLVVYSISHVQNAKVPQMVERALSFLQSEIEHGGL